MLFLELESFAAEGKKKKNSVAFTNTTLREYF